MYFSKEEFLNWEFKTRKVVSVSISYVDITEDLISGILLSQIIYWFLPSKNGDKKTKLFINGDDCIAKNRKDWWSECRVTPKQSDRAIKILENLGIIKTDLLKFNGVPLIHIWVNWDVLIKKLIDKNQAKETLNDEEILDETYSDFTDRENGLSPKVKVDFPQRSKSSISDITTDTADAFKEKKTFSFDSFLAEFFEKAEMIDNDGYPHTYWIDKKTRKKIHDIEKIRILHSIYLKQRNSIEKSHKTREYNDTTLVRTAVKMLMDMQGISNLDGGNQGKYVNAVISKIRMDMIENKEPVPENEIEMLSPLSVLLEKIQKESDFHWKNMTSYSYLDKWFYKITKEVL